MSNEGNTSKENAMFKVYTNRMQVGLSRDDIILRIQEAFDGEHPVELGKIIMSPHHAKAFLKVLKDTMDEYESIFGELSLAPSEQRMRELESKGKVIVKKEPPRQ